MRKVPQSSENGALRGDSAAVGPLQLGAYSGWSGCAEAGSGAGGLAHGAATALVLFDVQPRQLSLPAGGTPGLVGPADGRPALRRPPARLARARERAALAKVV